MDSIFLPATGLASEFLNASTRVGLFKPIGDDPLILVADHESGKAAVILGGLRRRDAFTAWMLEPNITGWSGLTLGAVELQLDPSTASREGPEVGDIVMSGGTASLHAAGTDRWDRLEIKLATTDGVPVSQARAISFKSWRLTQRAKNGDVIPLFSRNQSDE